MSTGQNIESLFTSMAEDIIDQRLRYRNNLIEDRNIRCSWDFKSCLLKTSAYFIATMCSIVNFIFIFYLMCISFFQSKIDLCEISASSFQGIILLPLILSIILAVISVLVPFFKKKYFKYHLGTSLLFSSSSVIFLVTYNVLYFKECNFATYSLFLFILSLSILLLLTIAYLVVKYYWLKKIYDRLYPLISILYDEEHREEEVIEERPKKQFMINDTNKEVEESLITT